MVLTSLSCSSCGLRLEGEIQLPNLAKLTPADREFIELFVISGGSLKEVGTSLGLSYPTVRAKLDRVISALMEMRSGTEKERSAILDRLERGEISAKQAAQFLREMKS